MESMKLKYIGNKQTKNPPTHLDSNIPKRYKRNAISVDLHWSKRISSNFDREVQIIKSKFKSAGYSLSFIANVIRSFKERNIDDQIKVTITCMTINFLYHHISLKLINVSFYLN